MSCIRWTAMAIAIIGMAASGSVQAAGRTNKGAARAKPAAPRLSPTEVLIGHLILNSYRPGENLAEACRRSNFKNLAIALNMNRQAVTAPKGEFETVAQYEERAARLASVLAADPIIVCEPLNDNPDVPFNYLADAQRFEGSFSDTHNVWRDVKQLGTYRSRTRMGIPATIRASAIAEFDISLNLPRATTGCLSGDFSRFKYRVSSPIAEAPRLKAAGKIVYIAKLEAPYIDKQEQSGKPTLDYPYDEYTTTLTVKAKPEKLFVIDTAGKEVWSCVVGAPDTEQVSSAANLAAIGALNAALTRLANNPRDATTLLDAGSAALALDDVDASLGFFTRAEQISPGNPLPKVGLAKAYVRSADPISAIRLFNEAEKAGPIPSAALVDRGLAHDLIGDSATAQRYYREAGSGNEESLRRLAISLAISGDKRGSEAALAPLLARQDRSAWRTRAFSLAILGEATQAVTIANSSMSSSSASGMAPYLRYMRQLTRAQQAAAANLGHFPRASEIGRDDPRFEQYLTSGVLPSGNSAPPRPIELSEITTPLRAAQAAKQSSIKGGDQEYLKLFIAWKEETSERLPQ